MEELLLKEERGGRSVSKLLCASVKLKVGAGDVGELDWNPRPPRIN